MQCKLHVWIFIPYHKYHGITWHRVEAMGGMPCHVTNHVKHDHKDEATILDQIMNDGILNKNGLHLAWINLCSWVKLITHAIKPYG
jgi:hypothetical protein